MRKVILAALILQLMITYTLSEYKFGDIISFKRKCLSSETTYKHFAIYVGGNKPDIGQGGHDIFQRTKHTTLKSLSDCIFDDLKNEEQNTKTLEVKVDNYLDGVEGFQVGTVDEMAARIKEKHHKCGVYDVTNNNCEHVATYVRYNYKLSLQPDTSAAKVCPQRVKPEVCPTVKERMKEIWEGAKLRLECFASVIGR